MNAKKIQQSKEKEYKVSASEGQVEILGRSHWKGDIWEEELVSVFSNYTLRPPNILPQGKLAVSLPYSLGMILSHFLKTCCRVILRWRQSNRKLSNSAHKIIFKWLLWFCDTSVFAFVASEGNVLNI